MGRWDKTKSSMCGNFFSKNQKKKKKKKEKKKEMRVSLFEHLNYSLHLSYSFK